MNRPLLTALLALPLSTALARADGEIPWPAGDQLPKQATLIKPDKAKDPVILQIVAVGKETIKLVEVTKPKLSSHVYVVKAKVKYEGVEPAGFVEMWSHFGENEAYFSRTLADQGPLGKLDGASDWRDLELPFESKAGMLPTKLVINVVLPGKGTVQLKPFVLESVDRDQAMTGPWWSERHAGLVGGLGGGAIGIVGALIGVLAGFGVGRQLTISLCSGVALAGAVAVIAGVVAWRMGQPWHVYYPLILGGGIAAGVCGLNLPTLRKRYDALELQRMTAMDA